MSSKTAIEHIVPGGILPGDCWHYQYDGTCSRCRLPVPDDEVPLMIFGEDARYMLVYCERCCKGER